MELVVNSLTVVGIVALTIVNILLIKENKELKKQLNRKRGE